MRICKLKKLSDSSYNYNMLRRIGMIAPMAVTCGALVSFLVALLGYALLGFLILTRYYMPASYQFVRPLHFDYTGYVAVASVPLSPNLRHQAVLHDSRALSDALLTKSRFLATGTQLAVHVVLTIPADHTDLFQVTGELMTNATYAAARCTRTYINTPQPYVYRLAKQFIFMPLHVLGWGHGEWVHIDLPMFDSYEEREDIPVAFFRARLSSRNASRGGLPPPPVQRAAVHVRLKAGYLQTMLFWLRPGLVASIAVLLLGLLASILGTTGAIALLVFAFFMRRWISRAMVAADAKAQARCGALPAPKRNTPPQGTFDDALSYSLATAEYYSHTGASVLASMAVEEDDGAPFGHHQARGRASRQGSAFSEVLTKAYESDTSLRCGNGGGGAKCMLPHAESAAWSGSSADSAFTSGGAETAPTAAGSLSRPDSGVYPTKARGGLNPGKLLEFIQPTLSTSPQPTVATDDDKHRGEFDGGAGSQKYASGVSGLSDPGEDSSSDEDEKLEALAKVGLKESEDEQCCVAGPKASVACGAEGHFSDLEPQADNEAAGAAFRRRTAFTWKA